MCGIANSPRRLQILKMPESNNAHLHGLDIQEIVALVVRRPPSDRIAIVNRILDSLEGSEAEGCCADVQSNWAEAIRERARAVLNDRPSDGAG